MEQERFFPRRRRCCLELNLFPSNDRTADQIRLQRCSTRLYIPLLLLCMIVLLLYTSLRIYSVQIQTDSPSLSTSLRLHEHHDSVQCPCRQISSPFANFIKIAVDSNPVCTSDLVSQQWIDFLYARNLTTLRYVADFRATAYNQFQLLRALCELATRAINNAIYSLSHSALVTDALLDEDLFGARVDAEILSFQRIVQADFGRALTLMRAFMAGNELLTAVQTAYTLIIELDIPDLVPPLYTNYYTEIDGTECGCHADLACHMTVGFYEFETVSRSDARYNLTEVYPREFLAGWKVACWPLESLLLSTLDSFYNQTVLNAVVAYVNASTGTDRFRALHSSPNDRFARNATIESLVDELFVDRWNRRWNYSAYYSNCQPRFCRYNVNERAQALYIITTLLGLYGGLSVVLRLLVPHLSKFLFGKAEPTQPIRQRLVAMSDTVRHLNLFRSALHTAPDDLQHQIWSTRLYLFLIVLSVCILTVYSSIIEEIRIIHINAPSVDDVQRLQQQGHPLTCPCQFVSINYEHLVTLNASYHQVCSSALVSADWIDYLNRIADSTDDNYDNRDYRTTASSKFHLLSSMCELSSRTVSNALFEFGRRQLITSELLASNVFASQMDSIVELFQRTLPNDFLRWLRLVRNVTNVNQLISGGYSNFAVIYDDEQTPRLQSDGFRFVTSNGTEGKCLCSTNLTCRTDTSLFRYDDEHQTIAPLAIRLNRSFRPRWSASTMIILVSTSSIRSAILNSTGTSLD